MKQRFDIGQKFRTRGKYPRECVVTDVLKTYNSKGELVKISYEAEHEFLGQKVKHYDVPDSTIAMGGGLTSIKAKDLSDTEAKVKGIKCVHCSQPNNADSIKDYEGWKVHKECAGAYTVWYGRTVKRGYDSEEEAVADMVEQGIKKFNIKRER